MPDADTMYREMKDLERKLTEAMKEFEDETGYSAIVEQDIIYDQGQGEPCVRRNKFKVTSLLFKWR